MTTPRTTPAPTAPASADARWGELAGRAFTKGHGTGNDFVLVTDPRAELELDPSLVARVCDRHRGLGGDGLIRAVRSEALPEGRELLGAAPDAEWFMDYRNNDGSVAEMCGNGVRVFVQHLVEEGLVTVPEGEVLRIGTRAGVRTVGRTRSGWAVDMGPWTFLDGEAARSRGSDAVVSAGGLQVPRPALSIGMGNPHTVVALAEGEKLDQLELTTAPVVRPEPEDGTNVEFVVPGDGDDDGVGRVRMRVHERGVGETQSCGTGACAAAAATRFWGGAGAPDQWLVEVPGGTVSVTFVPAPDGAEHVVLAGPAELVARGTFA
ncbi:diaminopimelate epimerase [Kocuria sp. LUK]|uniref:Diaminopimelate epimerase n=1 Tax=Kocuria flava TaxID=446860 RepID=A0A2N4T4D7_9MICC|nr:MULTISPECIES: diaminopimelate epimerase [Kocuria]MCD1145118.1 diaminopimelate epimerase [Kocuria sp. LUK]PLC13087.1 diaminopimelate epimerase [Kocuria flava]